MVAREASRCVFGPFLPQVRVKFFLRPILETDFNKLMDLFCIQRHTGMVVFSKGKRTDEE